MAQSSHPIPPDPQAISRAHSDWNSFTRFSSYAIIGVIAILILMAVFLL